MLESCEDVKSLAAEDDELVNLQGVVMIGLRYVGIIYRFIIKPPLVWLVMVIRSCMFG